MTPRQLELLRLVHQSVAATGKSPTVRELRDAMGFRSTNSVTDLLFQLDPVAIRWPPQKHRGISLTDAGMQAVLS
jgi:SOS-response transcriptional repressor LexA